MLVVKVLFVHGRNTARGPAQQAALHPGRIASRLPWEQRLLVPIAQQSRRVSECHPLP